ncbi:allophanate hydrolase [Oleiphilus sp. HI0009]|nr:allophanate hydrolase [Oleiphilus sp. HI0009]
MNSLNLAIADQTITPLSIETLKQAYAAGTTTPRQVLADIRERTEAYSDRNIWIHLLSDAELDRYLSKLEAGDVNSLPLWGVPFAIKDNIDLAGIPTTAACETFAYTPDESAFVVDQLIKAGAIPVGKTNLDQFATGLNGTRSPYGECRNAFDAKYISGGSSAGSSVSVALGLASFSLGTDTAGSGRVPACLNNLYGVKPTRGLLSASGMLPACRSLDCMTIFALNADESNLVLSVAEGLDDNDGYSRANPYPNQTRQYGVRAGDLKIGVIQSDQLEFFGDAAYEHAYLATVERIKDDGAQIEELDFSPFVEAAKLLYEGPWVTERYLATQPLIDEQPEAMFPVVREIIEPGKNASAAALFTAQYRLQELKAKCDAIVAQYDCLLTPTAGRFFTVDELLEEPVLRNSELGHYTNYMNLLDMSGLAIPTAFTDQGLPFGVTLVGPAFADRALLSIAKRFETLFDLPLGASDLSRERTEAAQVSTTQTVDVLVCGAHLEGLPLNWQLKERKAVLKLKTQTAPGYRMYALAGGPPFRPGLVLDEEKGAAIDVEIWTVPSEQFGSFVAGIPAPLGIGKVKLADGSFVSGFICEPYGLEGAEEITQLGGWRAYMATK